MVSKSPLSMALTFTCFHFIPKPPFRCRRLSALTFADVPGLRIEEDYLPRDLQSVVFSEVRRASDMADNEARGVARALASPAHNLPRRSEYVPVALRLRGFAGVDSSAPDHVALSAEHFPHYGDGHRLTYFRGNRNIPRLGLPEGFLDQLASPSAVCGEIKEARKRLGRRRRSSEANQWRLTLNHYPTFTVFDDDGGRTEDTTRVGFPWHRDLEANGAVSLILGLGSPGRLEFGLEEPAHLDLARPPPADNRVEHPERMTPVRSVTLEPGALLTMTGPARWRFVHRVLRSTDPCGERASLVYGVW